MTLQEVQTQIGELLKAHGLKMVPFTFPKEGEDVAFFVDQPNNQRLWFHITESTIPEGTSIRLSTLTEEAWKEGFTSKVSKRTPSSKKGGVSAFAKRREGMII